MILYNAAEMRDNMEQTEVLALGPEQHQLQQQQQHHHQQASLVGGGHFLHPTSIPVNATTPWSSVAHIKSEPLDKHDDSGISHGHYASDSASPQSLQSPLGSAMSPGSSGSQDSSGLSVVDYNNLGVESNGGSIDENLGSSCRSLYSRCQISPVLLKCPICGFADKNRLTFTGHLREHCSTVSKIGEDEFTKLVMEQLTNSKKASIGSKEEEEGFGGYERGIEYPCISSHGKVKIIYCKSCPAIFITKVDFWLHGRVHSRPGKRMDCPSCDFSTEFKHHLEYHLCNHLGSKPYKCDKCPYACVNKSMLNSHMKSHSNVYQFRCADCPYATKYCHALKLHLRKYNHTSAPVLNPDGTLNPDVIIDVYGKKRGPKPKSKVKSQKSRADNSPQPELAQPALSGLPAQVTALGQQPSPAYQFNAMNGLANMAGFNAFPGIPALMGFPFNQLLGHMPMANLYAPNVANPADAANEAHCSRERMPASYMDCSEDTSVAPALDERPEEPALEPEDGGSSPLDLSANCKPEVQLARQSAPAPAGDTQATSHAELASRKLTGTSRRKGRTRRLLQNDSAKDTPKEEPTASPPTPPLSSPDSFDSKDSDHKSQASNNDYTCQHCNISFGHEIMHLVHMAYHDQDNPFRCKKCATQANDSVSFFLHIVSNKH